MSALKFWPKGVVPIGTSMFDQSDIELDGIKVKHGKKGKMWLQLFFLLCIFLGFIQHFDVHDKHFNGYDNHLAERVTLNRLKQTVLKTGIKRGKLKFNYEIITMLTGGSL